MKTAQELRVGNVFMVGNDPIHIFTVHFTGSLRNAIKILLR